MYGPPRSMVVSKSTAAVMWPMRQGQTVTRRDGFHPGLRYREAGPVRDDLDAVAVPLVLAGVPQVVSGTGSRRRPSRLDEGAVLEPAQHQDRPGSAGCGPLAGAGANRQR